MKVIVYKLRHIAEVRGDTATEFKVFVEVPASHQEMSDAVPAATYPSLNEAKAFIEGYNYSMSQAFEDFDITQ